MANVYYFANIGGNGSAWSGYFEVSSLSDVVGTTVPSNIVVASPTSFNIVPFQVLVYTAASGGYITWRTSTSSEQYLSIGDGYSFDIWSDEFYSNIINSYTWTQMISFVGIQGTGIYALRTDKYTHVYDYGPSNIIQPRARFHGKGGYIQLSTTPVP